MLPLVQSALTLASEVMHLINSKDARKYLDKSIELQMQIRNEEAKGYYSDDAKIEALIQEAKIILDAVQKDIAAYNTTSSR